MSQRQFTGSTGSHKAGRNHEWDWLNRVNEVNGIFGFR
jgi:hypothetical protein